MIYPKWIKKGSKIGVTATSDGVSKELDRKRFLNGQHKLKERGYEVVFTDNVFTADCKGRSSSGKQRGQEMNQLLDDPDVGAIIAAKGGNYLVEMLPYIDFDKLVKNPKWFQGYSDNTGLVYTITTGYDIATVYGCNFGDFGMEEWHSSVSNGIKVLEGRLDTQKSFPMYQDGYIDKVTGLEGFTLNREVCWVNARGEKKIEVSGRLIGGCLDVLLNLVGTGFDRTESFVNKYKEDGILWYLESYDLNSEQLMMGLWQLNEAGWFANASGFVFGRPSMYRTNTDTDYREAILERLGHLNIPIILDADIGHQGPQFSVVNGCVATVHSSNGSGVLWHYIG